MLETLRIKIFGHQPAAKITNKTLAKIIQREFGKHSDEVKQKLMQVISDSPKSKNRISAAIVRLANKDINIIDHFISISNNDYRDIISQAEYPRCSKISFTEIRIRDMKTVYFDDWKEYSAWLYS